MPFEYEIDAPKRVARITVSGVDSLETILQRTLTIVRDRSWVRGMRMLVDFTGVERFEVDSADIFSIVRLLSGIQEEIGLGEVILLDPREEIRHLYMLYVEASEVSALPPVHLVSTLEEAEALVAELG